MSNNGWLLVGVGFALWGVIDAARRACRHRRFTLPAGAGAAALVWVPTPSLLVGLGIVIGIVVAVGVPAWAVFKASAQQARAATVINNRSWQSAHLRLLRPGNVLRRV